MHEASAAPFRLRRERWEEREAKGGIGGSYSCCWCCCWDCCERQIDGQVVVLGNSVSMKAPVFMLRQRVSGDPLLMQYMRQGNKVIGARVHCWCSIEILCQPRASGFRSLCESETGGELRFVYIATLVTIDQEIGNLLQ